MKINNFRGDLTDISAKKEALHCSIHAYVDCRMAVGARALDLNFFYCSQIDIL